MSLFQNGLICPLIPAACQVREHSIPLLLVLILPVFPRPLHHVPRLVPVSPQGAAMQADPCGEPCTYLLEGCLVFHRTDGF